MLQSEHYELKLVEGSDIVNPLVIDRPNYETIDGVMYGNESQAIGNATELKSGTIHAINRSKGNQRFFIFTATSNYELGDTFTVDSVPVTALMPNGTALPDMAYVVNGTVLCSLVGTLLTVYTVGSTLADDSLRLGGELPAYYAKQSDLTATDTLARGASTLSLANESAIRDINSNLTPQVIDLSPYKGSSVANLYGNAIKIGSVVFISIFAKYSSAVQSNLNPAVILPTELRPSVGTSGSDIVRRSDDVLLLGNSYVATTGEVVNNSTAQIIQMKTEIIYTV